MLHFAPWGPGHTALHGPHAGRWQGPPEPPAWSEVALSVYELNGAAALNTVTESVGLGGAYHVGIEVLWVEWSYGWNSGGTGVHVVPVGHSRMGKFRERVVLGRTPLTPQQVQLVLAQLREEWIGQDYHYLRQNCAHFCSELARRLCVSDLPAWVTSLAAAGDWLTSLFGAGSHEEEPHEDGHPFGPLPPQAFLAGNSHFRPSFEDPLRAKSVQEWRWAWEHSFKCAESAAEQEMWARMVTGPLPSLPIGPKLMPL